MAAYEKKVVVNNRVLTLGVDMRASDAKDDLGSIVVDCKIKIDTAFITVRTWVLQDGTYKVSVCTPADIETSTGA